MAVTYNPPTFKFEYTNDSTSVKYHKKIDLTSSLRFAASNHHEHSREITAVLIELYSELLQIQSSKIDHLIRSLISQSTSERPLEPKISMRIARPLAVSPLRDKPKLERHHTATVSQCDSVNELYNHFDTVSLDEMRNLKKIGDLNKVCEKDLSAAKDEMTKVFEKQQVLPSDAEYIYDKRMDFDEPDEESSWD